MSGIWVSGDECDSGMKFSEDDRDESDALFHLNEGGHLEPATSRDIGDIKED
jgi:hypothetical protein